MFERAVIVQARMTSKRFPGKSMAKFLGRPVLQHVLERCKAIQTADAVILACPDTQLSMQMVDLALSMDVHVYCGQEQNVLQRYWDAAMHYDVKNIIRVTGDCPLIDPILCHNVMTMQWLGKYDYVSNCWPDRTFPKGLDCEVFTFETLDAAVIDATSDYDKEHVTPWMQNDDRVYKGILKNTEDTSKDNWCVDWPHDIARLEGIVHGNVNILQLKAQHAQNKAH